MVRVERKNSILVDSFVFFKRQPVQCPTRALCCRHLLRSSAIESMAPLPLASSNTELTNTIPPRRHRPLLSPNQIIAAALCFADLFSSHRRYSHCCSTNRLLFVPRRCSAIPLSSSTLLLLRESFSINDVGHPSII